MTETIIEQAQSVLKITPSRWIQLTESVSTDLLERKPKEGEWSAIECLQHIIEVEAVFCFRVECFLKGEDFPAFDPDAAGAKVETKKTPQEFAQEFAALREKSLALFDQIKPEDLPRTANHQQLGTVSLEEMLYEWAGHDLMHTVQGERALMQPFIQNCGAWQSFFEDHWVK